MSRDALKKEIEDLKRAVAMFEEDSIYWRKQFDQCNEDYGCLQELFIAVLKKVTE